MRRNMLTRAGVPLLLAVAGAVAAAPAAAQVPQVAVSTPDDADPCGSPTDLTLDPAAPASVVAGSSVYEDGVFVHSDYVYDDYGASGVRPGPVADTSTAPAGSFVYPADEPRFVNNAADLRQLRLQLDGEMLRIEVHLQTLAAADTTAAVVGFGVDDDHSMAGTFPHVLGVSAAGMDTAVTLFGEGATLTRAGGEPEPLEGATVDLEANVLAVSVPLATLAPQGQRLRLWALAGLWDASKESFAAVLPGPATPVTAGGRQVVPDVRAFDVGFHPGELGRDGWFDANQAAALAAADVSEHAGELDLGLMRSSADVPWQPRPGYYEVVHESAFTLPPYNEGWTGLGSTNEDDAKLAVGFQGRFQPYSLYVPSQVQQPGPLALTIFFHGGGQNHSDAPSGTNMQTQLGEGLGSLIVSPLARRGSEIDYDGDRMADSREVLTDVHRRFGIDPNRRYLTGYSQGGNGVYRHLTLAADEWAAATIWAGQSPDATPWLESARWVPSILLHSPTDELVPYKESADTHERLTELGYEHELRTHGGGHLHQGITDDYTQPLEWFSVRVRDPNPARVSFVRVPDQDEDEFGYVFDSAYWLHSITAVGDRGVVEATTHGLGGSLPDVEQVRRVETGPPTPYEVEGLAYVRPGTAVETGNLVELDLAAIDSLAVDTARAGLDLTEPLEVKVSTNGPVRLTLSGLTGSDVALTGAGRVQSTGCGAVLVLEQAGDHVSTLTATTRGSGNATTTPPQAGPLRAGPAQGPPAPVVAGSRLPATGGLGAPLLSFALISAAAALARRQTRCDRSPG
jgi:dienelactone hydrolase